MEILRQRHSQTADQYRLDLNGVAYVEGNVTAPVSVWKASVDGSQEVKVLDSVHSEVQWAVREGGDLLLQK